ncbi:hypothetical protein DL764_002619 [Monosporascus ibericus]|uniref:Uncharacterized protein n=1 Tax=Monosporascus ibericus TaxID=155417 RepID=A0A4Q4TMB1_9PEZI|nr:hypothetical protein DL764_002619 [Monosporascus ibericus]
MASSPQQHSSSASREPLLADHVSTAKRYGKRSWNQFELDAVLALICKGHHTRSLIVFADMLNMAVDGNFGDKEDISVDDVRELLEFLEERHKGALRFIERQPAPCRLTRRQKLVFARELPFDGSLQEWTVGGRREAEMKAKPQRLRRLWTRRGDPDRHNLVMESARSRRAAREMRIYEHQKGRYTRARTRAANDDGVRRDRLHPVQGPKSTAGNTSVGESSTETQMWRDQDPVRSPYHRGDDVLSDQKQQERDEASEYRSSPGPWLGPEPQPATTYADADFDMPYSQMVEPSYFLESGIYAYDHSGLGYPSDAESFL